MKTFASLLTFIVLIVVLSINARAQTCPGSPGCLDLTFGVGGTAATYIPTTTPLSPGKGAIQSDGKILAAVMVLPGSSNMTDVIIRYNPDGSLDTTFGNGGIVTMNWLGANNTTGHAYSIAVQTVGTEERIVVAGTGTGYTSSLRVDRFHSDGSPDLSFGSGGTVTYTAGAAETMAIQPDGKILTMGTRGALVRLNLNGTLDTTFGNGGFIQNNTWRVQSIALQSNGRIVAAGYWTNVKGVAFMSVWRFNTNGSLDDGSRNDSTRSDTFGTKGQTTITSFNTAWDVKIDATGKIVVAGSAGASGSTDFAVARLTTAGQLDSTFGAGGKATVDFSGFSDQIRGVDLRSNGQIVAVGFTYSGSPSSATRDAAFARFNSNGTLDSTFGQGGKVVTDFSSEGEFTSDGMIQFDTSCNCEKVIAIGTAIAGGIYYAVAARSLL
ncbi:MAG: hypothetical protein KA956_05645 [Pyrinomonadaceae bacterium]|nr:hypothetical protein [Acidobacteriota bacterium]MBP7375940.1 hypothetical protein [Pyrinomonadaceae bacterium]